MSKHFTLKEGVLYESIKSQIRPFDVIFFKGYTVFSDMICLLERYGNKIPNSGEFSHVGLVVTSDILKNEKIKEGKLYLLESIIGGFCEYGVWDINNKCVVGVQIRELDTLILACDKPNNTIIAWGKLQNNPIDTVPLTELQSKFGDFYDKYYKSCYDVNPVSLLGSVFPFWRRFRSKMEKFCKTNNWFFCSELVALAFKQFNIYPETVNEKDVLPRDIIYPDADVDEMPKVIGTLVHFTTSQHKL